MALAGQTLLKVDGSALPKLKDYTASRPKLYKDGGRNMSGEMKNQFLGVFLKIKAEFAVTTEAEMSTLIDIFDRASFDVQWYDEDTNALVTTTVYSSDFDPVVLDKDRGLYKGFKISLISTKKIK